jgi:hypothetical protein
MRRRVTRGRLAACAALVLAALGVLPFLVFEGPYGEVPIPGSAAVHLPAGEVDVTLRTAGPVGDESVPPLSIRITGPDGTARLDAFYPKSCGEHIDPAVVIIANRNPLTCLEYRTSAAAIERRIASKLLRSCIANM